WLGRHQGEEGAERIDLQPAFKLDRRLPVGKVLRPTEERVFIMALGEPERGLQGGMEAVAARVRRGGSPVEAVEAGIEQLLVRTGFCIIADHRRAKPPQ